MKKWIAVATSAAVLAGIAVSFGYLWMTKHGPRLTIATWEGTYGRAQITTQIAPFARTSGADAIFALYDGGTRELAHQVATKQYAWDVIDLELPDAVTACALGLLEPIDAAALPVSPQGRPAAEDFVPGAIGPCWVASVAYSQVIAVAPRTVVGNVPLPVASTLSDFFDVQRFKGKRALSRSSAKLNLEMALLADGVAPKDVYAVLSTPQGVTRALTKLDTLHGNLVWYSNVTEAKKMLSDGRLALASLPNWAVFDADNDEHRIGPKLGIIWDRQLYEFEAFGIPKGNPKRKLAMDFVRFATQAQSLGGMASWIPYGPARLSALPLVQSNPDLKVAMTPYLPTAHFDTAFAIDDGWWRLHGADIDVLWQDWLAKEP
jgi:putative spermidine/putrescine transport system substrate-binding protein